MSAAGNTFLALEWNSRAPESDSSNRSTKERERRVLIENGIANFFCEKRKFSHVEQDFFIGYRAQQPIEEFPRPFQKLGLIPVDALTVDDVISLLVAFPRIRESSQEDLRSPHR